MGEGKHTEVRRKKREVAVAPRSGAKGYRITAWLLAALSVGLMALSHHRVGLYPGDKLFPMLWAVMLCLAPPLGAAAGVVGFFLSRSPAGKTIALLPAAFLVPLWLWLLWELMG